MKLIPLTKGYCAIVDDEDYERLLKHKWTAVVGKRNVYALRTCTKNGKKIYIYMHREILGIENEGINVQVDHINHSGIDNRRINLRIVTPSQNQANRIIKAGTSKYKGVYRHPDGKWHVCIGRDYRRHYLGLFADEREAARAYDAKAKELSGEFSLLNFPD